MKKYVIDINYIFRERMIAPPGVLAKTPIQIHNRVGHAASQRSKFRDPYAECSSFATIHGMIWQ
jgi:hypothetical protein